MFFFAVATFLIVFTFPIVTWVDMKSYTIIYMVELGATASVLVALFYFIKSNIDVINSRSGQNFVDENI